MTGPMPFDAVGLDEAEDFLEPLGQGPVSRDLRQAGEKWWQLMLPASMGIWRAARISLGLPETPTVSEGSRYSADISSEAIEHAEALGL